MIPARRRGGAAALVPAALLAAACGGSPAPGTAPTPEPTPRPIVRPGDAQYRFEILRVSDSTFSFVVPGPARPTVGERGIVVDPRRRDALIARFRTLATRGDTIVALVTGQTTDLATSHVALLPFVPPRRPGALRQRSFWVGLLTGGALGAATAIIAR